MSTLTETASQRGTGFPVLALDDAVAAIKTAGQYGRTHTNEDFARYLGGKSTSSGSFIKKMAALRDFGLIGQPRDGQIAFTELGSQLAYPSSPDEEQARVREAFFKAVPFAETYRASALGTDLQLELVANKAVTALNISAQRKREFANTFARSAVSAGLARRGENDTIRLLPAGPDTPGADPAGAADPAGTDRPPARQGGGEAMPAIHQIWPFEGGQVSFQLDLGGRPLPAQAFAGVARVAEAIEEFVASLTPPPAQPPAAAAIQALDDADELDAALELSSTQ